MYLSRVRPIRKNRVEQSLEEAPFSILLRDKQHTQPRGGRAPASPGPEAEEQASLAPRTGAARSEPAAGRGTELVARRALNLRRDRERKEKEINPSLGRCTRR